MSWYTNLFCNIEFSRETFNSIHDVYDRIEENEKYIEIAKNKLRTLAYITEPNKFCPSEEDPIIWIENEMESAIETIEESNVELYKLHKLIDNWNKCHNEEGLAIDKPKDLHYDTAYISGDFINTASDPTKSSYE
jgi:hypothetical protein